MASILVTWYVGLVHCSENSLKCRLTRRPYADAFDSYFGKNNYAFSFAIRIRNFVLIIS